MIFTNSTNQRTNNITMKKEFQ